MDDVKVNTHNINNRVTKLDSKMSDMLDAMGNVQVRFLRQGDITGHHSMNPCMCCHLPVQR